MNRLILMEKEARRGLGRRYKTISWRNWLLRMGLETGHKLQLSLMKEVENNAANVGTIIYVRVWSKVNGVYGKNGFWLWESSRMETSGQQYPNIYPGDLTILSKTIGTARCVQRSHIYWVVLNKCWKRLTSIHLAQQNRLFFVLRKLVNWKYSKKIGSLPRQTLLNSAKRLWSISIDFKSKLIWRVWTHDFTKIYVF